MPFFLAKALIAAIAGGWIYLDAQKKISNHNTIVLWVAGAVLLSLTFTPLVFGLVALYIWNNRRIPVTLNKEVDYIDIEATPIEDSPTCPKCRRDIKEDLNVCPYCGYSPASK